MRDDNLKLHGRRKQRPLAGGGAACARAAPTATPVAPAPALRLCCAPAAPTPAPASAAPSPTRNPAAPTTARRHVCTRRRRGDPVVPGPQLQWETPQPNLHRPHARAQPQLTRGRPPAHAATFYTPAPLTACARTPTVNFYTPVPAAAPARAVHSPNTPAPAAAVAPSAHIASASPHAPAPAVTPAPAHGRGAHRREPVCGRSLPRGILPALAAIPSPTRARALHTHRGAHRCEQLGRRPPRRLLRVEPPQPR